MDNWKDKIYSSYVSNTQAGVGTNYKIPLSLPYPKYLLKKLNLKNKNTKIIDLGCGFGKYLKIFIDNGFTNVIGVDISKEQLHVAKKNGINNIINQDIFSFLNEVQENSVDVFLLMDVLEHLDKSEIFNLIESIKNKLKPKGKFVVHCPNGEGLFFGRTFYGDFTHQNAFTFQSIHQIFKSIGFSKIKIFEDKPLVHNFISLLRRLIWEIGTIPFRILLLSESPGRKPILSQNFLVIVEK
jgi:2-polyprenyl-3-methyl-5-hydroxy-6-metoxy-1,4-benzoquinol methylase